MQQAFAMEEISRKNQLPGQRFCPMDDELLLFYLKPMLSGKNVPGLNNVVFVCDLYGSQEPWEIWETYKTQRPHDLRLNKDLYFFTQHKTKSSTDKRISRNVGRGTWKGNDRATGKPIESLETGRKIGSKKRFTYDNEASEHHGCWIMHEFYLDRSVRDKKEKANDYVLCLLRKNGEPEAKNEKKRRRREEEEVLEKNDACDDGEQSNMQQEEEFLEPESKRQRTVSAPAAPMPSEVDEFPQFAFLFQDDSSSELRPSEAELAAFAARLINEPMQCVQDDDAPPSEADRSIGFQGVKYMVLQQSACEVQPGPSVVPLPEDDSLMNQCFEEICNFSRNMEEEQDPAGSNKDCEGSTDWINSISFSPEDNAFVSFEMLSSYVAGVDLPCNEG